MQFFARPQRTFETRVASVVSSATVLGLVVAGLSLGAVPLSAAAATTSPLSSLKNFTVLTEANFTTEGSAHEVEGSAAVGGDMIINKAYILGSPHNSVALPLLENRSTQLLVGGTLRLNQSGEALQTNAGAVRIRTVAGHSVSTGGAPQSQGNNFIADMTPSNRLRMPASTTISDISAGTLFTDAFGSAFTELRANSSMIAGYTATDVALISFINGTNFNGISGSDKGLELVPNKVNVVRATAAQISAIGTIKFLGPQGQQNTATLPSASTLLIFDITDSGSVSLTAPEQNINAQAFTVWNFANATALTVQGKGGSGYLKGSILAPNADMIFAAGYIEGQIAVKSLVVRSGGEIHHVTYGGDLPDPRTVSASPTFSDGTCAPSNRTNTLAAAAVDHVEYTWTANPTASLVGTKFTSFSNTALPAGTYAFSIATTDGYTLSGASSFSHTFAEPPADCRVKDATGTFSFTPPTCTVAASYTLGVATNATYTVSNGTTTETGKTAGTYAAQNGVTYTITIVPNDGHALATGTLESESRTFSAPTDCVTVDATGSFSFTPPTCEAGGSYTLGAATNATYTVTYGSTTETGKTAGTSAMPNGVAYTITVVPNAGHALVAGVAAPETRTFSAPTNCVTTDATGSFSFTPPTCQAGATYTLGAATNATYTVTSGSTTETAKTAGSYPMQAGVEYTITVVPNSGHALVAGVVVSGFQSFEAVTGCVVQNATASFSFTPPTCTTEASYTLGTPTNATYTVTYGSTTETGKTAGNFPMQTGVEYTVRVVPNPGHALVARAIASDSRTFSAPTDCIVSDATGSFAFAPPTCEVPAGSYTLGAAFNATYTVAYGSTVETPDAGRHAMPNGVAYTITLVPDAGHALVPGVAATETRTFSAPTGCISPNARGSFQFTPPTCEVDATYTLNAATNATYRVTTSTGRSTTVEEGTHPMDLDSTYTIAVVPDEGYALADGVVESDSETFSAPVDCVEQNATGSFSFVPPTCEAGAAYTLNAATNATYTVTFGSTTLTGRTAGTYSMANDVEYTITVVANDGHSLVQGIVPGSQTYAAPSNCETTDAVGTFSFTPPTCTTDASYTLDAVTNASYTVTHGSTTETGKGPGSYSMELGVDYTITVVPDAGHALIGGAKSQTQAYDALTNCTYVDTDPYGSTCTAQGENVPPAGMTSWIWFLIDDRVIYTIDGNPERVTTPFVEVTPGVHVAHAVAAPGFVLAPSAEREWTINVVDSSVCGEVTAPTIKAQLSTACFANVPWIDYSIELIDPDNQASNRDAELILTNGTETETIALGTIGESNVIEGRILWPGAAVDADGKAAGWPGWQKTAAGEWVETTGNFAWTRALTSMTASVNPVAETAINYPAATSECANPPVPPTVLKALVNTGVGVVGTLWFAAALAALGVLGLLAARRSRRDAR